MSNIQVTCVYCRWIGSLADCGFGHDDHYCPCCGKEGGLNDVLPTDSIRTLDEELDQLDAVLRTVACSGSRLLNYFKDRVK